MAKAETFSSEPSWAKAETGLFLYGFVETLGAVVSGVPMAIQNSVLVQMIVVASWVYSSNKEAKVVP